MKATTQTNPTLSRRLKRALLATLLMVLILATAAAGLSAYWEASDIQDDTLLSIARLVESNQLDVSPDSADIDDDFMDDNSVRVWGLDQKLRNNKSKKKPIKTGFHTWHEDDDFWRVYVTQKNHIGKQYAVAQPLSVSAELALQNARNTAIPLLLLFLLVPLLVTLIVRHSFKPLNTLTKKVASSKSLTLDLAQANEIPVEVLPFVTAIDSLLEKNKAFNNAQRRFIADAAHELRTPITALSLAIENVQTSTNETIRAQRQSALANSISRLQRLVNQLLDLARAQSALEHNRTLASLNELVKFQIADLYLLAEEKNIELDVSRNDPLRVTDVNSQLQHLIRNALSNAIKFTPEGGNINMEIYQDDQDAVFSVIDSGPGVHPAHLDKLHEPFFSPDGQASGKGAGLGLAICREIASHLQGKLTFENVKPTGFKFSYRQPVV